MAVLGRGTVKSFNAVSGYGFIVPDETGSDLWVHLRNVVDQRAATLAAGDRVEFEIRVGGMGPEAINVHALT
jgi:CspA family cold shock protein